jgi:hypothetical protein
MNTYISDLKSNHEIFNPRSYQNEMQRVLRAGRGFPDYQLKVNGGADEAAFLARYAGLRRQNGRNEVVGSSFTLALELHADQGRFQNHVCGWRSE